MNENNKHNPGLKYNFFFKLYLEIIVYYRKKKNCGCHNPIYKNQQKCEQIIFKLIL